MLILALDTATSVTTVAVAGDDIAVECREHAPNRHAEVLVPLIDRAVREAGADRRDLGAVGVGVGPGPFTGLRVGLVTAAALSDALRIPAYAECSLDVIARQAHTTGAFVVTTDARRRELYWAAYDENAARLHGPAVDAPAVIDDWARARGMHVVADIHPDAAVLARMVLPRADSGKPSDPLIPLYLRRPDARPPSRPKAVTPA